MAYYDMGDRCAVCGMPIAQSGGRGRVRRYCSDRCRQRACRSQRVTKFCASLPVTKNAPCYNPVEFYDRGRESGHMS